MRVAVVIEQRFDRTPDGHIWTEAAFAYPYWRQYLGTFDAVLVMARVRDVSSALSTWARADGEGVSFLTVPYYIGPVQFLWRISSIRQTARRAPVTRDAVILRVPSQIATSFMPFLRRTGHPYGVQVVGDPHDLFAPGANRHVLRPLFRRWFSYQLRNQCAQACACAYVTERALQSRYPSGINAFGNHYSDVFLPDEAYVSGGRPGSRSARVRRIVTVGSLHQLYKGVDALIDAVAVCIGWGMDLSVTVVGDGRYRFELEARAKRLGLAARFRFVGALSDPETVRSHLDQADLFVLPSRTEGLPRAMVEAMARGLPCIGSHVGGIPELLPDSDIVPPGSARALAVKMRDVLGDPARLTAMSAYNLAKARQYRAEILSEEREVFLRHVLLETKRWINRHSNGDGQ